MTPQRVRGVADGHLRSAADGGIMGSAGSPAIGSGSCGVGGYTVSERQEHWTLLTGQLGA